MQQNFDDYLTLGLLTFLQPKFCVDHDYLSNIAETSSVILKTMLALMYYVYDHLSELPSPSLNTDQMGEFHDFFNILFSI